MRGVLLIAHGSRSREAQDACARLARSVAAEAGGPAEVGYLELAAPDVAAAGRRLVEAGCTSIAVIPLLVAPGRHAAADVPRHVRALSGAHPAVRFAEAPPIGEHAGFAPLVARAARDALRGP